MPILGNPGFPPGLRDHHFSNLRQTNHFRGSQFLASDGWPSITALMESAGPFCLPFWNALQLHHFLYTLKSPERFRRQLIIFEEYCTKEGTLTQTLSKMYTLLISPLEQLNLSWIEKWEREMDCKFTTSQRQNMIDLSLKSSICTKNQEINYKVLPRWYYTPQRLHTFYPEISDRCWRCMEERGTMFHIFW